MNVRQRLQKLEGRNNGLHYLMLFARTGESDEQVLARTLVDRGLRPEQVGYAILFPNEGDGHIRTTVDRCDGDPSKLIGLNSLEVWLSETDCDAGEPFAPKKRNESRRSA